MAGTPGTLRTEYTFPTPVTGRYLTIECTGVAGGNAAVLWELEANGVQIGETASLSIAKIPAFTDRKVAFGTKIEEISLPGQTTVSLDNGKKAEIRLQWDCADYNGSVAGEYTFIGTPVLEETSGIANPNGVTASAVVTVAQQGEDLSGRQVISLCDGWSFKQGSLIGAQRTDYNDAGWATVNIPHTWNAFDGQDGGSNYYRGDGWYRKVLDWNESYSGKRVALQFLGACLQADVYVNEQKVGTHKGGYTAFCFDVTDALIEGQENIIAVRVNNSNVQDIAPLSGDFTVFGGIYREVSLIVTDTVHVDTEDYGSSGLYLQQSNVSHERADLEIRSNIVNDADTEKSVTVRTTLKHPDSFEEIDTISSPDFDPDQMVGGGIVEQHEETFTIPAGESVLFRHNSQVENPHLWNGRSDPYRYEVILEVYVDGERTDHQSGYVGFRYYTVDYDNGFFLNGESYPLRGVSRHQDREDMGNALTETEHNEDFGLIYEIGANSVRLAHYPQAPYFYDLCDRYGIVVWAEIPFVNNMGGSGSYESPDSNRQAFFDVTKQQLVELIRQQYNRPSICFWSLQNEVLAYEEAMPEFMQELNDLAHQEDPTRLTTQATDKADATAWASDLIAWNRYPGWYFGTKEDMGTDLDEKHAADSRPLAMSEYGAGANIEQHVDKATNADKSLNIQTEEYQSICHESFITQINERPYLWATYVWNMFDFSCDWRSEGGLQGVNTKGLVSRDRKTRKDSFYLYKANWGSDPFVHITGSRNNPRQNSPVEIKGYSNCDSVELIVNGTVIGKLTQDDLAQRTVFVWENVALSSGENTVIMRAEKDGEIYTDTIVWDKVKSASTDLQSDTLSIDNASKIIGLSVPVRAEDLQKAITSSDATLELFLSDGITPVSTGAVRAGMLLRVTSEDGTQVSTYTFTNACLSQGKPVAASSYQNNKDGNNPPSYVTDGDGGTRWAAGLSEDGTQTTYPQWITVDLEGVYLLSRIDISWFQSSTQRKYYYTVSVSEDGESYQTVVDRSNNTLSGLVSDTLDDVQARYVRIDISDNSNWPGNSSAAASIYEIKIYGEDPQAGFRQLEQLYTSCKDLVNRNYTPAAWAAFETARSEAEALLAQADPAYDEVERVYLGLLDAYNALLAEEQQVLQSDVDGDGSVTVSDVVELRKLIVQGGWSEREFAAGNLDGDGTLSVSDVVELRKKIVQG